MILLDIVYLYVVVESIYQTGYVLLVMLTVLDVNLHLYVMLVKQMLPSLAIRVNLQVALVHVRVVWVHNLLALHVFLLITCIIQPVIVNVLREHILMLKILLIFALILKKPMPISL